MSVAIHPSETRPNPVPPRSGRARSRLFLAAGILLGGTALAGFTAGAFSFFSGLADPRARPAQVAPVASQWPDLKDGVPALAEGPGAEPTRLSLPPAEPPAARANAAPAAPMPERIVAKAEPIASAPPQPSRSEPAGAAIAKAETARPETARPEAAKPEIAKSEMSQPLAEPARSSAASGRTNLPIEPVQALAAPTRAAAPVAPPRTAATLAPARSETVRAKAEQPARFVSLPASKADSAKATPKPEPKAEATRKPVAPARTRVTSADAASPAAPAAAPAPTPAVDDEPELLGVKIPGGRQIRDGWKATVGGLIGDQGNGE
ncbi:hypothetical protein [Methylorubrum sp. POS3]|uniref:hypothetical protein n=1 Tax=Methylorubrum sp. POS3 TaxID=2998492 RepID=UPI003726F2CC